MFFSVVALNILSYCTLSYCKLLCIKLYPKLYYVIYLHGARECNQSFWIFLQCIVSKSLFQYLVTSLWGRVNLNSFFSTSNASIVCVDMYNTKTYCYNKSILSKNHSPFTRGYLYIFLCVVVPSFTSVSKEKSLTDSWASNLYFSMHMRKKAFKQNITDKQQRSHHQSTKERKTTPHEMKELTPFEMNLTKVRAKDMQELGDERTDGSSYFKNLRRTHSFHEKIDSSLNFSYFWEPW